jgi:transcriptional regulator with XRE-family HTH domain
MRQAQAALADQLRARGHSWAEIGEQLRLAFRVNARVALRLAHGWSQSQAAQRWNERWPADPKTFKNISYWELWPASSGHAPSLETLDRLAQLYRCKITDLLADCEDHGARPVTAQLRVSEAETGRELAEVPGPAPTPAPAPAAAAAVLETALERIRLAGLGLAADAGDAEPEPAARLRRRTLLLEASAALAVVAAAPVLEVPRLAGRAGGASRAVDEAVVAHTGQVVAGLRSIGGAVGPRIILAPAMALRSAMAAVARGAPETVTEQALTVYGDLTQLLGWLLFNLGDLKAARYYYDDARQAAHRARDANLVSYVLAATSQLAGAAGDRGAAVEHALAARVAARGSGSPYAVAYAADVTARAYAAGHQGLRCQTALDAEYAALAEIGPQTPREPWWYFYDRSFYWGTESDCSLSLGMPVDATDAADRAFSLRSPMNAHNSALTLAFRAQALIGQGELDEACRTVADIARLATLNSSRRIIARVTDLRAELQPAAGTAALRDLDEKLAAYRQARAAGQPG